MSTDEKKPPEGGDVIAQIKIDLLSNGGARMTAQCAGVPDSSYATKPDRELPIELAMLMGELRARAWFNRLR